MCVAMGLPCLHSLKKMEDLSSDRTAAFLFLSLQLFSIFHCILQLVGLCVLHKLRWPTADPNVTFLDTDKHQDCCSGSRTTASAVRKYSLKAYRFVFGI